MKALLTVAATALALAVLAAPAAAKGSKAPKTPAYTYYATIDCGSGPIEVGSWDDLWAPLVDLESGRKYKPIAWHVAVGEMVIDEVKKRERKRGVECSYSDGVATGTVTVKKGHHRDHDDDD